MQFQDKLDSLNLPANVSVALLEYYYTDPTDFISSWEILEYLNYVKLLKMDTVALVNSYIAYGNQPIGKRLLEANIIDLDTYTNVLYTKDCRERIKYTILCNYRELFDVLIAYKRDYCYITPDLASIAIKANNSNTDYFIERLISISEQYFNDIDYQVLIHNNRLDLLKLLANAKDNRLSAYLSTSTSTSASASAAVRDKNILTNSAAGNSTVDCLEFLLAEGYTADVLSMFIAAVESGSLACVRYLDEKFSMLKDAKIVAIFGYDIFNDCGTATVVEFTGLSAAVPVQMRVQKFNELLGKSLYNPECFYYLVNALIAVCPDYLQKYTWEQKWCLRSTNTGVLMFLGETHGVKFDGIDAAYCAKNGNLASLKYLESKGVEKNKYALMWAIMYADSATVEYLIQQEYPGYKDKYILIEAVARNRFKIAHMLISKGYLDVKDIKLPEEDCRWTITENYIADLRTSGATTATATATGSIVAL